MILDKCKISDLEQRAKDFAEKAHAGQTRKYTGEKYTVHTQEVADIVRTVPHTQEMLAAAHLHDTVEDCGIPLHVIDIEFGAIVADMVSCLTDVSKPSDGMRKKRKEIDRMHTATASADAKTVKLADLISNSKSIMQYDPDFAKVYLKEKAALLKVLGEGDAVLWNIANEFVTGNGWKS